MLSVRSKGTSCKRNLRNGAVLAIAQTTQLVNFPLVQEVAEHVQKLVVALKVRNRDITNWSIIMIPISLTCYRLQKIMTGALKS